MQLTYIATLALLSAYAALASGQEMNVSLPLAYEAKIFRASEISGQCPSSDQRNTTFTEIKGEVRKIIQDYVLPIIQDAPIEPTVSPSNSSSPCCGEENTGWTQAVFFNMTDTIQATTVLEAWCSTKRLNDPVVVEVAIRVVSPRSSVSIASPTARCVVGSLVIRLDQLQHSARAQMTLIAATFLE